MRYGMKISHHSSHQQARKGVIIIAKPEHTNFKFNILFPFFTFLSTIKYTEHFELFECATVEHFLFDCVFTTKAATTYIQNFSRHRTWNVITNPLYRARKHILQLKEVIQYVRLTGPNELPCHAVPPESKTLGYLLFL